jgi:hypothetical protein
MVTAIENEAQRAQRGKNAHRHARNNYSWHHVASQVVEVYERHAQPTRPRAR